MGGAAVRVTGVNARPVGDCLRHGTIVLGVRAEQPREIAGFPVGRLYNVFCVEDGLIASVEDHHAAGSASRGFDPRAGLGLNQSSRPFPRVANS